MSVFSVQNEKRGGQFFNITVFTNIKPKLLFENLTSIRFKINLKSNEVYWKGEDEKQFIISPFRHQNRNGLNGYRIYSNYPISTILYLFDGALGWIHELKVSGVESEVSLTKTRKEHLNEMISHPSLQMIDTRGIFIKDDISIILLQDKIVLQRRSKLKKLNNELKKIEAAMDLLLPSKHDLFSFLEEDEKAV
ncbi:MULTISPECIES: hypothetical protein [Oceanobacillus]|uniref:DUF402 domain-containing protein n=1 Tax=Oceanobacillus kimchii TaxID=746691 RepID=A0ABQ5TR87_9BACI|nr:hypothetical protein [Oceanobacillus kimchii]GLO68263.1 hypothetical protein MACH08_40470 [Oceanobacillus kimchii]